MTRTVMLFAALSLLNLPARAEGPAPAESAATPPPVQEIQFDRAENGTLYFKLPPGSKEPASLKADLHDIKYLGVIRPDEGGLPYFLLSGRPCPDCIQDAKVYFVRPQPAKPLAMVYPGKIFDSKSRALLLESRAFFGKCLYQKKDEIYVVFQKERVDRRHRMQASVFIAEFGKDRVEEKLLERNLPSLNDTLKLVKKKTCREVDGRNRLMLKKAFEFKRAVKEEDDDDDETDPKESAATKDSKEAQGAQEDAKPSPAQP